MLSSKKRKNEQFSDKPENSSTTTTTATTAAFSITPSTAPQARPPNPTPSIIIVIVDPTKLKNVIDGIQKFLVKLKNKKEIQKYWNSEPLLAHWFTGNQINTGTAENPILETVAIKDLLHIFQKFVLYRCTDIVKTIWFAEVSQELREWYRGKDINIGTALKPQIITSDVMQNLTSAMHTSFLAEEILNNNDKIKASITKSNPIKSIKSFLLSQTSASFKEKLLVNVEDKNLLIKIKNELENPKYTHHMHWRCGFDALEKRIEQVSALNPTQVASQNMEIDIVADVSVSTNLTTTSAILENVIIEFNKRLATKNRKDIESYWNEEPLIREWCSGNNINLSDANPSSRRINIEDLIAISKLLFKIRIDNIIKCILRAPANTELREWFRGKDINYGTKEKPKYLRATPIKNLKDCLNKFHFLFSDLWTGNDDLHAKVKTEQPEELLKKVCYSSLERDFKTAYFRNITDEDMLKQVVEELKLDKEYKRNKNWSLSFSLLTAHIKSLSKTAAPSSNRNDVEVETEIVPLPAPASQVNSPIPNLKVPQVENMEMDDNTQTELENKNVGPSPKRLKSPAVEPENTTAIPVTETPQPLPAAPEVQMHPPAFNPNLLTPEQIADFEKLIVNREYQTAYLKWVKYPYLREYFFGRPVEFQENTTVVTRVINIEEAINFFESTFSKNLKMIGFELLTKNSSLRAVYFGEQIELPDKSFFNLSHKTVLLSFIRMLAGENIVLILEFWNKNPILRDVITKASPDLQSETLNLVIKNNMISYAEVLSLINNADALQTTLEYLIEKTPNNARYADIYQIVEAKLLQVLPETVDTASIPEKTKTSSPSLFHHDFASATTSLPPLPVQPQLTSETPRTVDYAQKTR